MPSQSDEYRDVVSFPAIHNTLSLCCSVNFQSLSLPSPELLLPFVTFLICIQVQKANPINLEEISRLITITQDVLEKEGPSQDLAENEQALFSDVVSTAWRIYRRRHDDDVSNAQNPGEDVETRTVTLVDQILLDRQWLLLEYRNKQIWGEDVPLPQRLLNLQTVFSILEHWVPNGDISEVCPRHQEVISQFSRAIQILRVTAMAFAQWQDADNAAKAPFAYFQSIEFGDMLRPDIDVATVSHLWHRESDAWLAGGLTSSAGGGGHEGTRGGSASWMHLTVSVNTDALRLCFNYSASNKSRPKENYIQSQAILTVHPLVDVWTKSYEEPGFLKRVTMVMKSDMNVGVGTRDDGADDTKPHHNALSKCVWFDSKLTRWSPSGCVTFDTGNNIVHEEDIDDSNEVVVVLCECNHLTDFALMLYPTNNTSSSISDTSSSAKTGQYSSELEWSTGLALVIPLILGTFSTTSLIKASGLYSPTALRNVVILNSLLMAIVVSQTSLTLGQIIFGHRHPELLQWSARLIAPILIFLRFSLYTFFTLLIITPLVKVKVLSYSATKAMKHSRFIVKLCGSFMMCSVCLLIVLEQGKV